jgi:FtsZ-interacting cell division protein ZipA
LQGLWTNFVGIFFALAASSVGSIFDDLDQVSVVLDKVKSTSSKSGGKDEKGKSTSDKKRKREDSPKKSSDATGTTTAASPNVVATTTAMDPTSAELAMKEPAAKRKKEKETINTDSFKTPQVPTIAGSSAKSETPTKKQKTSESTVSAATAVASSVRSHLHSLLPPSSRWPRIGHFV